MTKHINPGTDTTINPVVIDDSYRERKQGALVRHRWDLWIYAATIILCGWIVLHFLSEATKTYFALGGIP